MRLTVVTGQALGGASLANGELEIMQDRRLSHDDERGLGQGVLDNQPVLHLFRIILDKIDNICNKVADEHPAGALTLNAFRESQTLLSPIDKFIYIENDWLGVQPAFGANHVVAEDDVIVVAIRNLINLQKPKATTLRTGVIVHRTSVLNCASDEHRTGVVSLRSAMSIFKQLAANFYFLFFLTYS